MRKFSMLGGEKMDNKYGWKEPAVTNFEERCSSSIDSTGSVVIAAAALGITPGSVGYRPYNYRRIRTR